MWLILSLLYPALESKLELIATVKRLIQNGAAAILSHKNDLQLSRNTMLRSTDYVWDLDIFPFAGKN